MSFYKLYKKKRSSDEFRAFYVIGKVDYETLMNTVPEHTCFSFLHCYKVDDFSIDVFNNGGIPITVSFVEPAFSSDK